MAMKTLDPDQVVAENLTSLRHMHDLTLDQTAELVNRYLADGLKQWTRNTVFDAEGGRKPTRKLSAAEISAICRAFGVSLLAMMLPPKGTLVRSGESTLTREDYGWLIFQLQPDQLAQATLDVNMLAQAYFLDDLFSRIADTVEIDELSEAVNAAIDADPRLQLWVDSPIQRHAVGISFRQIMQESIDRHEERRMQEGINRDKEHGER